MVLHINVVNAVCLASKKEIHYALRILQVHHTFRHVKNSNIASKLRLQTLWSKKIYSAKKMYFSHNIKR